MMAPRLTAISVLQLRNLQPTDGTLTQPNQWFQRLPNVPSRQFESILGIFATNLLPYSLFVRLDLA